MTSSKPPLSAANMKYLIAVRELDRDGKGVRCVAVAELLHITKPSVHSMMATLQQMQLVEKAHYGVIRLTDAGRALADRYCGCLEMFERHFQRYLPTGKEAHAAARALLAELPLGSAEHMCAMLRGQTNAAAADAG